MRDFYATFGYGQTHPLTGAELADHYTRVPAETYDEARALMHRSVFGQSYAFMYDDADGARAAGVKRYGLREVPFVPPSPLSDVVWAAYERLGHNRPDRWVEYVSQPLELAWHRLRQAEAHDRVEAAKARVAARESCDAEDRPPVAVPNDSLVGMLGDRSAVTFLIPVPRVMSPERALALAAWIVAVADPSGYEFDRVLRAVLTT